MCGIAGIFAYGAGAAPVDERELLKIREAMGARGPDGSGIWLDADRRIGLAHRRLALVDLSDTGAQPMANADGTLRIVFNGEIYNHRELRRTLEADGYQFRSTSDTEVLLHLYAAHGVRMFDELRGMYSLAIWDALRRRIVLARDPFGMKPLYYADDGRTLRIASQVKALLRGGAVAPDLDAAGQVGFFLLGCVPEPWTAYQKIKALPAGHCLAIGADGSQELTLFCDIRRELAEIGGCSRPEHGAAVSERIKESMARSVGQHLLADVPVGVFLSAGLDSSSIAALAAHAGLARIDSITLGFKEYVGSPSDETAEAAGIAARLGLNHHTRWVSEDDFDAERSRLFDAMDQPSIDGVNTYFVSMAARALGFKAALSGLGGDELFGGYPSYRQVPRIANLGRLIPGQSLGAGLRRISAPIVARLSSPKYASILEYGRTFGAAYFMRRALFMPWELESVLDPEVVKRGLAEFDPVEMMEQTAAGIEGDHLKVAALEMTWYMRNQLLRDADWAGMAHSIEIRMPMVDLPMLRELMPAVAAHPEMSKARFLSEVLRESIPRELLARPKTGFSVPVRQWLPSKSGVRRGRGLRDWASLIAESFGFAVRPSSSARGPD
ncbi:MAG TPA: asparagine synthase (glutamine-hydrolyzing) [Candidatus Binataceae bacterium]|nr:asparagine synthase (glutamine-hydrolyzing) [Candidatus Binataceae bacterium]